MLRSTLSSVPPRCCIPQCCQWTWMVQAASRHHRYQCLVCHVLAWAWRRMLALSHLMCAASACRRCSSCRWVTVRCHHAWMWQALCLPSAWQTSCPHHQAWVAPAVPWLSWCPLATIVLEGGRWLSPGAIAVWEWGLAHLQPPWVLSQWNGWVARGRNTPQHGGDTPDVKMALGTLWWGCGDIAPSRQSCAP